MRRSILRLAAVASVTAGCATIEKTPLEFPAVMDPARPEHHAGKVIFVELVTPDLEASKRFYGQLFGWTFRDVQSGATKYAEVSLDGQAVAGLFHRDLPSGKQRQPAWLTYISVADVDVAAKTAADQRAKVLFEPHTIPNRGREAVFSDPQGAVFAVLFSSSGDPPEALAAPGEWIWSTLMTTDPRTDAVFYQALFGYQVFDLPAVHPGAQHLMLASDNYARASANTLPATGVDFHP